MASTKEYINFVLDLLSDLDGVATRAMMGEYVLYCRGKVVGGIYDDRLLLKPTKTAVAIMENSDFGVRTAIPYPGAKEMLIADVDDRTLPASVVDAVASDLPEPKPKKK